MLEILLTNKKGRTRKVEKPVSGSWINLVDADEDDVRKLEKIIDVPEEFISSLKDLDEIPSIEKKGDEFFIIFKTPQKNLSKEMEYSTVPLGIMITKKYLITVCFYKNDVIERLKKLKVSTQKKIQTTLKMLYVTAKLYLRYLKEMNKKIYRIQHRLEVSTKNEELMELLRIEKSLVYFNTSLKSNYLLIKRLMKNKLFTRYKEDQEILEDVVEETKQAIQTTEIHSSILSGMMDAFASIISNNLNIVMKLLTSITIILMIPTLVASIYGMNIKLPFQESPNAFLITMLISIGLSLLGILIFWRKELL